MAASLPNTPGLSPVSSKSRHSSSQPPQGMSTAYSRPFVFLLCRLVKDAPSGQTLLGDKLDPCEMRRGSAFFK